MNIKNSVSGIKSQLSGSFLDTDDSDIQFITEKALEKWEEPEPFGPDTSNFSVLFAWDALFNLPTCTHALILPEVQRKLGIMIGKNVTQEFPWRQVAYGLVEEHVLPTLPQKAELYIDFKGYGLTNPVLMGYVPMLTQHLENQPEGDPFIFYVSSYDTKRAMTIIENIERYEYWHYRKNWVKRPNRWISQGSERELKRLLQAAPLAKKTTEVQSVYPVRHTGARELTFRLSADVRDGLIELLPTENEKYDNVVRRRIPIGVQVLAGCVEQSIQTQLKFPTRAFVQYDTVQSLEENNVDKSDSEEERERGTKRESNLPKQPVVLSRQIKRLLSALEFSLVNFYRNDYSQLTLRKTLPHLEPHLEEAICFANISKTNHRYICGVDWYPSRSGLLVTSYVFNTVASSEASNARVDYVKRAVLQPNPVLLWSFNDILRFKIEFYSPQEVTSLCFCPFESNVLIGGLKNGQIVVWDLQNRVSQMDQEEFLTAAQARNRRMIRDYLKETIFVDEELVVSTAAISSLEDSHKSSVTGIYWLGRQWFVNSYGKFYENPDKNAKHKCFISCAIDGSVLFWDLDRPVEKKHDEGSHKVLPKALAQSESKYKRVCLKPIFAVCFDEPITGLIADTLTVQYVLQTRDKQVALATNSVNAPMTPTIHMPNEMRQSAVISSMYGHLERINWTGVYADAEQFKRIHGSEHFARVHDGPVICMKKNPFIPQVFVSIGRTVFAIWRDDYHYSPIMWRRRKNDLTAACWSTDRPSVFYLTRTDGSVEVWDILTRDDNPCLESILGGGMLTGIIEHGPKLPEKLLGVGDFNSSFRMVKLPPTYYKPVPLELQRFSSFVSKEVRRKRIIQSWEEKYHEDNREFIEAKREAEIESRKQMERIERENEILQRSSKTDEEAANRPTQALTFSERQARAWEDLNKKRLMNMLMSRLQMDTERLKRETALEKTRLAYEEAKKKTHEEMLKGIDKIIEHIRSCLLPEEVVDTTHIALIGELVSHILEGPDFYEEGVEESREFVSLFGSLDTFEFLDYLQRGVHRRRLLNKSMGGSTERAHWYDLRKTTDRLPESIWGYQFYTNDYEVFDEEEGYVRLGLRNRANLLFRDTSLPTSLDEYIDDNDADDEQQEAIPDDLLQYLDPVRQTTVVQHPH